MDFSPSPEQEQIIDTARGLARRSKADRYVSWEEAGEFPWEFMATLASHDLTGIDISEDKGGQGLELIDSLLVIIAVAETAPHLADAVQATNFGAVRQLAAFGSDRVTEEVLRPVLAGKALATIAMSEPGGGSALSRLHTRAKRVGDQVEITGSKVFNSSGPHATHFVVWARFAEGRDGIGAVVVPADAPGFTRGATERFISGEAHCTLSFDQCSVPAEYVLVDQDGLRRMMSVFNIERLGNASRSYAYGEAALDLAIGYALERETPSGHLADFQGLRWKLADQRLRLDAAKLLLFRAASELRDGVPDPLNTSLAKCAANEAGFEAVNQALQVFGGYGFTTDSPLDYLLKRTRGWMIAGGSVEMQRQRIAREIFNRHPSSQRA